MTSDQHAQLLHSMVAIMERQAKVLEHFQKSKQLGEIKIEGAKLPTYGVDWTNHSNDKRSKWSSMSLQEEWTGRVRWDTEARSRSGVCEAKIVCPKRGRLLQQSRT